jgi:selenophosphate synthetase-related protein
VNGPKVFLECRRCGAQFGDGIVTVRDGAIDPDSPLCSECIACEDATQEGDSHVEEN